MSLRKILSRILTPFRILPTPFSFDGRIIKYMWSSSYFKGFSSTFISERNWIPRKYQYISWISYGGGRVQIEINIFQDVFWLTTRSGGSMCSEICMQTYELILYTEYEVNSEEMGWNKNHFCYFYIMNFCRIIEF